MKDLGERILPRIAALGTVWLMAEAVDPNRDHWWLIFSFLAMALVLEFLAFRHGVATGIQIYKSATPKQRKELDQIIEGSNK